MDLCIQIESLSKGRDTSAFVSGVREVTVSTIAGVMWQGLSMYRFAFAALLLTLGFYAVAMLSDEAIDLSEFLSSLHHEILNPLTGVLGAIELLRDNGVAQTDKTRILDCAEQATHRIGRLIKGLPDLESLERTAYVGGTTMIDLGKLKAGAEESPGSQAGRNRATSASSGTHKNL